MVNGDGGELCEVMRNHHSPCGPEGLLFRPLDEVKRGRPPKVDK